MVDSDVIAAEKHWAAVAEGRKIADEEDIAIGEALLIEASPILFLN